MGRPPGASRRSGASAHGPVRRRRRHSPALHRPRPRPAGRPVARDDGPPRRHGCKRARRPARAAPPRDCFRPPGLRLQRTPAGPAMDGGRAGRIDPAGVDAARREVPSRRRPFVGHDGRFRPGNARGQRRAQARAACGLLLSAAARRCADRGAARVAHPGRRPALHHLGGERTHDAGPRDPRDVRSPADPLGLCRDSVARDGRSAVADPRVGGRGGSPSAFGRVARQALRVDSHADRHLRRGRRQGDRPSRSTRAG